MRAAHLTFSYTEFKCGSIACKWALFYLSGMKKNTFNPEYEAFAARLRQAMKDAGLKTSATLLADSFNMRYWGEGITAHAARNWMFGVSMPKQDKLKALSEVLNISPQDLLFGPQHEVHAARETQLSDGMGLGDTEMLRQYLQLQPEHKRMVRQWVRMSLVFQQNLVAPSNAGSPQA
jgi:transcriptional regulator with XRE-family HTH domain